MALPEAPSQTAPSSSYRRLRGLRWTPGSRSVLRLAHDHLLLCDYRTGFVERYKRFYFRDIEAFIIRRTQHWLVAMLIWGAIAFVIFLLAVIWRWNITVTLVLEGICALFVIRHLIRGPSCRTHIQTAVQTDLLPMLKRVRKTDRILQSLFPLIEEAQGKMDQQTLAEAITTTPPPAPGPESSVSAAVATPSEGTVVPARLSFVHLGTFALVVLNAIVAFWELKFSSTVSYVLLIVLFFLSTLVAIFALVRQAKRPVHRAAAALIWFLVIAYVIGGVGVQTAFTMLDTFARARRGYEVDPPSAWGVTPLQIREMAGFEGVLWVYAISSLLLGLVGLLFIFLPAPAKGQPPPLPQDSSV